MDKKIIKTEEHHRRSRFTGGGENKSNISNVPPHLHKAWHVLFGSMNAIQICNLINKSKFLPPGTWLFCEFINGSEVQKMGGQESKNENKRRIAWNTLFSKCSDFHEIISYINNVWLDPSYRLRILPVE